MGKRVKLGQNTLTAAVKLTVPNRPQKKFKRTIKFAFPGCA